MKRRAFLSASFAAAIGINMDEFGVYEIKPDDTNNDQYVPLTKLFIKANKQVIGMAQSVDITQTRNIENVYDRGVMTLIPGKEISIKGILSKLILDLGRVKELQCLDNMMDPYSQNVSFCLHAQFIDQYQNSIETNYHDIWLKSSANDLWTLHEHYLLVDMAKFSNEAPYHIWLKNFHKKGDEA